MSIIYCWFPNIVCSHMLSKLSRMSFELEPSEVMRVPVLHVCYILEPCGTIKAISELLWTSL